MLITSLYVLIVACSYCTFHACNCNTIQSFVFGFINLMSHCVLSLQFAEQSNSHTNPWSMGHEEQAVPHRH